MKKLLLVMQFSPHDRAVMLELMKLVLDMEEGMCPYADLMFSAAYGADHDQELIARARKKFDKVFVHKCIHNVTGWPAGPNSQVREVVDEVFVGHRDRGWDYAAFMLMEPDGLPLRRTWIKELYDEWHHGGSQRVLGAWMESGQFWCYSSHINGNCLIDPLFVKENKFFRTHATGSWDTYMAPIMLPVARPSKLIYNDYRIDSVHNPLPIGVLLEDYLFQARRYPSNHPLAGQDIFACYYHGLKGTIGIEIVRKRLLSLQPT